MGYIHDNDRPMLSSVRRAICYNEGKEGFNIDDYISTAEVQTDNSISRESEVGTNTIPILTQDQENQANMSEYSSSIVVHSPVHSAPADSDSRRSRYTLHQTSVDNDNTRYHNKPVVEDETTTQRRRRRRERARSNRSETDRYSYPTADYSATTTAPAGVYESHYSSLANLSSGLNSSDGSYYTRRRPRRYATMDD